MVVENSTDITAACPLTTKSLSCTYKLNSPFEQTRAGNKITTVFGFAGALEFKNGKIQWAFTTNNTTTRTITLAINAEIKLGNVHANIAWNMTMEGGEIKGVTFLLGFSV